MGRGPNGYDDGRSEPDTAIGRPPLSRRDRTERLHDDVSKTDPRRSNEEDVEIPTVVARRDAVGIPADEDEAGPTIRIQARASRAPDPAVETIPPGAPADDHAPRDDTGDPTVGMSGSDLAGALERVRPVEPTDPGVGERTSPGALIGEETGDEPAAPVDLDHEPSGATDSLPRPTPKAHLVADEPMPPPAVNEPTARAVTPTYMGTVEPPAAEPPTEDPAAKNLRENSLLSRIGTPVDEDGSAVRVVKRRGQSSSNRWVWVAAIVLCVAALGVMMLTLVLASDGR